MHSPESQPDYSEVPNPILNPSGFNSFPETILNNKPVKKSLISFQPQLFSTVYMLLSGESDITTNLVKRLPVTSSELLEGHAWSSDDELFAVASCSCKVHVFQVTYHVTAVP